MRTRNTDKEKLVKQMAMDLVVKEGIDRFSMNKLAKACKISVATLYIYYQDKDDLITKIAEEEVHRASREILQDFNPKASFEEGLKQQWKNRLKHMLENPTSEFFLDQLRSSSYNEKIFPIFLSYFRPVMREFMTNAIERGEIDPHPIGVYWSIAFAPLYNLVRFHRDGNGFGGQEFALTDEIVWQTFDLVIKALKK